MKKLLLLFLLPALCMAGEVDCDKAKLSYLLEHSVAKNEFRAAEVALELGANPNGVSEVESKKCFSGMPTTAPVMHAANFEDVELLALLLKSGASAEAWCCDSSALQRAEKAGNEKAVKLLRQYGAK